MLYLTEWIVKTWSSPIKLNLDVLKMKTRYINGIMLECYFEAPCEYAQSRGTLAETKWPFDVGPPLSKSVPKQSTFVFPSFNPK